MRVISFVSVKGGVAKTTSAISTAKILSEKGYHTLLIDADPQNAATSHFVDDLALIYESTIRQILTRKRPIEDCIMNVSPHLDFISSEIELSLIDVELASVPNRAYIMFEILEEIAMLYDYVVIDTPPSIGFLEQTSIIASDLVIIPSQLEKWSVRAINATLDSVSTCVDAQKYLHKNLTVKILPTFFERNRNIKSIIFAMLKEAFGEKVFSEVIHTSTEVAKTYAQMRTFLSPSTRPYREYEEIVDEILSIVGVHHAD